MASPTLSPASTIEYPSADGQPMAESDFQRKPLTYAVEALDIYFQDRPDVYVSGNLFIYYEEGNPQASIAPDVLVVLGAPKRDRPSYMLWSEPKAPDFVLEITSRRTRREDQETKPATYAQLGVQEYWQYDPTGDYLMPALQGFRLVAGHYEPLPATVSPEGARVLHSMVLGLDVSLEDGRLRFINPATGQRLLTHQETEQARRAAEERAAQETALRQAAEARVAEMEARLQALLAADAVPLPPPPADT
jgi:Uma2 family endonuclease